MNILETPQAIKQKTVEKRVQRLDLEINTSMTYFIDEKDGKFKPGEPSYLAHLQHIKGHIYLDNLNFSENYFTAYGNSIPWLDFDYLNPETDYRIILQTLRKSLLHLKYKLSQNPGQWELGEYNLVESGIKPKITQYILLSLANIYRQRRLQGLDFSLVENQNLIQKELEDKFAFLMRKMEEVFVKKKILKSLDFVLKKKNIRTCFDLENYVDRNTEKKDYPDVSEKGLEAYRQFCIITSGQKFPDLTKQEFFELARLLEQPKRIR